MPTPQEFWNTLPHCAGFHGGCDGDLIGEDHIASCPLYSREEMPLFEFAEAYHAHASALEAKEVARLVKAAQDYNIQSARIITVYSAHDEGCPYGEYEVTCTCGLNQAMDKLRQSAIKLNAAMDVLKEKP